MDPLKILHKYYKKKSKAYYFLINHSNSVTQKAVEVARRVPQLKPDITFIEEAGMLHEIGLFMVNAPGIGCYGKKHYLCHGYLGRELLEKEGFPKHALVCERHTGVGLTKDEIISKKLPLPKRNMLPISIEEQIICFADNFFSKNETYLIRQKPVSLIRKQLSKHGSYVVKKFDEWLRKFKEK